MTAPNSLSCYQCVFWIDHGPGRRYGSCRRYPPVLVPPDADSTWEYEADWPKTADVDWCGEWKPKGGVK